MCVWGKKWFLDEAAKSDCKEIILILNPLARLI